MAEALMKWETIDRLQIDDLMAGNEARPPMEYNGIKDPAKTGADSNGKGNSPFEPDRSFA
ncbi:MAG: hypothetical protein ACU85E_12455, partial [Gammaproteobacteria bacterium]